MKRKCAVKTAGSLLLAGALAFAPQGSFLGNMQGIKAVQAEETDDWAIYWYLCGSDLESNYGSATEILSELMEAELPENVKIVIETGGSSQWQNETVEADYLDGMCTAVKALSVCSSWIRPIWERAARWQTSWNFAGTIIRQSIRQ